MSNRKTLSLLLAATLALTSYGSAKAMGSYTPREEILHTVKKGDTLIELAELYLGDGSLNDELSLYLGRAHPDHIYIGEVLRIPDKEVLLGNIGKIDKFGSTPLDMENPRDLKNKYYEMVKGDNYNGIFYKLYNEIFEENPELENILSYKELRLALYIENGIDDEYNMQIGTKIYLMEYDQLIDYAYNLKVTNKLLKTR